MIITILKSTCITIPTNRTFQMLQLALNSFSNNVYHYAAYAPKRVFDS